MVSNWTVCGIAHSLQDRGFASICTSYNQDAEFDLLERTAGLSYAHLRVVHRGDLIRLDVESLVGRSYTHRRVVDGRMNDASLVGLRLRVFVSHVAGLSERCFLSMRPTPSFSGAGHWQFSFQFPT